VRFGAGASGTQPGVDTKGGNRGRPPDARDDYGTGQLRHVNAYRLWTGGLATAVVAALVAVVGVLIARGLFGVPVLAPTEDGALGNASTAMLAGLAAGAALLATGLMHLLLVFIPRPRQFFAWIISLATLAAVLLPFSRPFSSDVSIGAQIATAAINLAIGVAIGLLISGVAASAARAADDDRPNRPTPDDR
jgi:hypothetical protein